MPTIRPLIIKASWVATTVGGLRIYESQQGRYFRDVVQARARETVIQLQHAKRSAATCRRRPYVLGIQHLEFRLPRAVRQSDYLDGAA